MCLCPSLSHRTWETLDSFDQSIDNVLLHPMHEDVARVIQEIPSLLPDPLRNEHRVAIREIVDIHYSRHLKRFFVLASFCHSLLDAHTAWIDQALFDRPILHYKCNNKAVLNALKKRKHLASTVIVGTVIDPPKLFGQIIPLPPGMSGFCGSASNTTSLILDVLVDRRQSRHRRGHHSQNLTSYTEWMELGYHV